jgi:hypothetical protein
VGAYCRRCASIGCIRLPFQARPSFNIASSLAVFPSPFPGPSSPTPTVQFSTKDYFSNRTTVQKAMQDSLKDLTARLYVRFPYFYITGGGPSAGCRLGCSGTCHQG